MKKIYEKIFGLFASADIEEVTLAYDQNNNPIKAKKIASKDNSYWYSGVEVGQRRYVIGNYVSTIAELLSENVIEKISKDIANDLGLE